MVCFVHEDLIERKGYNCYCNYIIVTLFMHVLKIATGPKLSDERCPTVKQASARHM